MATKRKGVRKSKSEYYHVSDGETIRVPWGEHKEQCCDCGLVHRYKYRRGKNGELLIRTFRDGRATGGARSHKNRDDK